MNRTNFIQFLEKLKSTHYASIMYGDRIINDFTLTKNFEEHLQKTISILKQYDEEYKKEQEALPTFKVFLQDLEEHARNGFYIYRFELANKKWEFTYNDIICLFGENSRILTEYVVVDFQETPIDDDFGTIIVDLTLDNVKNYNNVKRKSTNA